MQPDSIRLAPPSRPVVLVALAYIAGLVIGLALVPPRWPLIVLIAGCLVAATINWRRSRRIHGPRLHRGVLLLVAFGAFGAWQGSRTTASDASSLRSLSPWMNEPAITISGVVAEPPRVGHDWAEVVVADAVLASREKPPERIGLNIALRLNDKAAAQLAANPGALPLPGRPVKAEGWLTPITGPANPSTFDSTRYWLSRGIGARMNINRPAQILVGPEPTGWRNIVETPMRRLRLAICRNFDLRLAPAESNLARALVLGQAELIANDTRDAFRLAGWAHLLAVSGQNAGIVLLIFLALARVAFVPPRAAAWIAIAGVIFYMALTGFLPPVTRAGIMLIFLTMGYALGRLATGPASLSAAALVTLICDPRNLMRIDWQLSYVCVLSMILIAPPIYEWLTVRQNTGLREEPPSFARLLFNRYFLLPGTVSLAIHLGLFPLQIAYFRQTNLLLLVSNIFGILLASVAMVAAMATAAFGAIPGLGAFLGSITNGLLMFLGGTAHSFANIPGTVLTIPVMTPLIVIVFYGLLLTGRWLLTGQAEAGCHDRSQIRNLIFHMTGAVAIIAAIMFFIPLVGAVPREGLDLYMLDVGQGDSLVLRAGNRTMVIDAGPNDSGRMRVDPFLRTIGVDRIDCLVATHADADHVSGMAALVKDFKVGEFIQGADTADSDCYKNLIAEIANKRVHTVAAHPGDTISGFGETKIKMLGPLANFDDNNASVVLLVEHGNIQILLMGDLEHKGEQRLQAAKAIPDVEVLKVGHHGSKSSTGADFLSLSKPELALVSVGANNNFNHPSPEVIDRLDKAGAKTLRTDRLGAIWLHITGDKVEVYRYK